MKNDQQKKNKCLFGVTEYIINTSLGTVDYSFSAF